MNEAAPGTSAISAETYERLLNSTLSTSLEVRVEQLTTAFVRLRLTFDPAQLRPGNSIAGPVMFTMADAALYALALAALGPEQGLPSVTSDLAIRFLRRPPPADLIAEGRLLKRGRRLLVGEVTLWSHGVDAPVAHATGTYALPRV